MLIKTDTQPDTRTRAERETDLPSSYVTKRPFDRTKLAMVPRGQAASAAHLALFQLQDNPSPETQMLGVGVLFAAFCNRLKVDPHDLYQMSMSVLNAPPSLDGSTDNSLQVLRDFAAIRMAGEFTTIY